MLSLWFDLCENLGIGMTLKMIKWYPTLETSNNTNIMECNKQYKYYLL